MENNPTPESLAAISDSSGEPHSALFLVLAYLRLPDLIAVHRVCRPFRDAVAEDVLLWRHITVEPTLSRRLSDDALVRITSRAGGTLVSLALRDCCNITDAGLLLVADQNPAITKLCVTGCSNLTADGLVTVVKHLSEQKGNIKILRLSGLCNITREHVNILSHFLCKSVPERCSRPSFYSYQRSLPLDDDHPIDVDVCPKCENVRMVFDCTRKSCRMMKSQWTECRGCFFCIARCEECGGCMDLEELEEAACSDLLCLECWLRLPKCNLCNQPYCKRHAIIHGQSSGSDGFVCERSAKLGIQSPPPYLSLSPYDDALLQGVNYASGGAGILNETGVYFIEKLSFDDQIACFEATKVAIETKIGRNATEKLCNEAGFLVGLGSNDYVNNFLQPFLADSGTYTHGEFLDLLITTLDGQLKRLYKLGVRKLVFHGLGPLGCIPSQRVKSKDGQCLKGVNQWVLQFNGSVKKLLISLNSQFPAAQFSFADSYYIVLDLIEHPRAYGFKISNTSCCNVDTGVGGLCLPNSDLCDNRKDYVFWDAFHPTDAANEVVVNLMFSNPRNRQALSPAPSPSPR